MGGIVAVMNYLSSRLKTKKRNSFRLRCICHFRHCQTSYNYQKINNILRVVSSFYLYSFFSFITRWASIVPYCWLWSNSLPWWCDIEVNTFIALQIIVVDSDGGDTKRLFWLYCELIASAIQTLTGTNKNAEIIQTSLASISSLHGNKNNLNTKRNS